MDDSPDKDVTREVADHGTQFESAKSKEYKSGQYRRESERYHCRCDYRLSLGGQHFVRQQVEGLLLTSSPSSA